MVNSALGRRIASAAVLAPLAVAATIAGPPWFSLVVGLFAAAMGWEWARLCGGSKPDRSLVGVAIAIMMMVTLATEWLGPAAALLVALPGGLLVGVIQRRPSARAALAGAGMAYLAVAVAAVLAMRGEATTSALPVLWLFSVVWAADIAAYFTGKSVGGPRLAPAISPGKTWSGFAGGTIAAVLVGWVLARWFGAPTPGAAVGIALVLAVVAQIGDLAESAAKRYFGVKDASGLIPGHGGVLDRLDGLMAAALALAAMRLLVGEDFTGWQ